jgi:hypothetical protein
MLKLGRDNIKSDGAIAILTEEVKKGSFKDYFKENKLSKKTMLSKEITCEEVDNLVAFDDFNYDEIFNDDQVEYRNSLMNEEPELEDGSQMFSIGFGNTAYDNVKSSFVWSHSFCRRLLAVGFNIMRDGEPPINFYVPIVD